MKPHPTLYYYFQKPPTPREPPPKYETYTPGNGDQEQDQPSSSSTTAVLNVEQQQEVEPDIVPCPVEGEEVASQPEPVSALFRDVATPSENQIGVWHRPTE